MTQVEVCNLALGWIGAQLISSIDDATVPARLCKAGWEPTRDLLLESREWSFAIERFTLAPDATPPAFGYSHRFQIPSTVLRVLTVVDGDGRQLEDWQKEGSFIVCDYDVIYLKALVRVEATSDLSTAFCHALAARLAADLAIPISDDAGLMGNMVKLYQLKMKEAAALDGLQGRTKVINGPGLSRVR